MWNKTHGYGNDSIIGHSNKVYFEHTPKKKKICVLSFIYTYTVSYCFDILKFTPTVTTKQFCQISFISLKKQHSLILSVYLSLDTVNTHNPTANIHKFHIAINFAGEKKNRATSILWQFLFCLNTLLLLFFSFFQLWKHNLGWWEKIGWKDVASTQIEYIA